MVKLIGDSNPLLKQVSEEIDEINEQIKSVVQDLIVVTKEVDTPLNFWLGMAAPQIGVKKRLFIIRRKYKSYDVFINPQITNKSLPTPAISKCYGLKGVYFPKRYFFITLKYKDLNGKDITKQFIGGKAWVIQHEIDHLNGILVNNYLGLTT